MAERMQIQQFPLWARAKAMRVPLSFDLEVTARCNNDCRHCYINLSAGDPAARARELTVAEIDRIASEAAGLGALWCLITGGEPLLRQDFPEIYLALKRRGLLVSVFTNATLIDREHLRLFSRYPPRDIEVTVYGATRSTYEAVSRRPGSFDAFLRGLDLLREGGVPVRLKTVAIRSNLREQAAIAAFCRARTKDFFRFDPQLHLRYDGDPVRNDEIRSERLTTEEIVALERDDPDRLEALRKECASPGGGVCARDGCDHLFHCGAGANSFTVGPDGTFRLCSSLRAAGTTYDLRTGTLAHAWRGLVPRVRDLRSHKKGFLETCRACGLANLCLWCPAHAHLETGELDGETPYFCDVAHRRAEHARTDGRGRS